MNASLYRAINLAHPILSAHVSGSQRSGYIAGGLIMGTVMIAIGWLWAKSADGDPDTGCGVVLVLVGFVLFVVGAAAIFGV